MGSGNETASRFNAVMLGSALLVASSSCRRGADEADAAASRGRAEDANAFASGQAAAPASWPAASAAAGDAGGPRPGMVFVPAGAFRAGTPPNKIPRVPDEEMPGTAVEMSGFYIDHLPWPNEPNAIPTSNVSRDEAEQLCASKGKRLCSELEWERACKGPDSTTYEYGDVYRKESCGTGVTLELAARRPTGELAQCKSGFGVAEMHGGVWEWTSSAWGRGSRDASQGVLRGGNSPAGELVGRCANAIARAPSKKAPTMGLRCCAGPRNGAEVKLDLQGSPSVTLLPPSQVTAWASAVASAAKSEGQALDPKFVHAWSWVPVANEALVVVNGCTAAPRSCAVIVGRPSGDAGSGEVVASIATGKDLSDVARGADMRHLRVRSLDVRGVYSRELTYLYGRIDVGEPKRR